MSAAEMKLEVINKITTVEDEMLLKEVLALLEDTTKKEGVFNLSKTYDTIKDKYGMFCKSLLNDFN